MADIITLHYGERVCFAINAMIKINQNERLFHLSPTQYETYRTLKHNNIAFQAKETAAAVRVKLLRYVNFSLRNLSN